MTLKLLEPVGRGAHGEVWRATWGGKVVAAKLLDGRECLDERRVLEEADALRGLADPTFIRLEEVTQLDGRWALLLEWVDGDDLSTVLRQHGPAPAAAVKSLFSTLSKAMAAVWNQPTEHGPLRLLHRDLKPENLMLQPDGGVRIADLGLATRWIRPGQHSAGTPDYAAPERFLGEDGQAGDIYALGAIGYELLTGRRFGIPGPHQRAHQRKLRAVRADLAEHQTPTPLAERVTAMLSHDPSDRPSYADLGGRIRPSALRNWTRPSLMDRLRSWMPTPSQGGALCAQP